MKTFEIKRKVSTLLRRLISIAIIWLGLLVFTDRSLEIVIPALVGSVLVILLFVGKWVHTMSFSEYEIRLKKVFSTKIIKTNEVTKIELKKDCYQLASLHDAKIIIPLSKLTDEQLRKLVKYFKH